VRGGGERSQKMSAVSSGREEEKTSEGRAASASIARRRLGSGLQNDRDCSVGRSVGDRPSAATPHPVMVDLTGGETRPRGYTST
jgi:hypothetical protein